MKRSENQWDDDFEKAMEQAPEGWNRMTDEALDEMGEAYKKESKEK